MSETGLPCEVGVLIGQPDYDDCVEAMKLGAFHYLRKPMEPALIEEPSGARWSMVAYGARTRHSGACWRQ